MPTLLPILGTHEREILEAIDDREAAYESGLRPRPAYEPEDPWAEGYLPERLAPGEDPADEWVSFNPPWLY